MPRSSQSRSQPRLLALLPIRVGHALPGSAPAQEVGQASTRRWSRSPFLHWRLTIATLALAIPAPLVAQGQLDTLRVDSLMAVAADRVRSAAIAAARENAEVVRDIRTELFGYGGLFGDVLGELAATDCEWARHWVKAAAEELFWLGHSLSLAWERSVDGEMDLWSNGPEFILDNLEDSQEAWADIKNENREFCHGGGELVAGDFIGNTDSADPASAGSAGVEQRGGALAERTEAENVPEGPICTGDYSPDPCWMEVSGRPGCYLWNPSPQDDETVTWNGECPSGLAQGMGRTTWYENHEVKQVWDARAADGKADGWALATYFEDEGRRRFAEGCFAYEWWAVRIHGYEITLRSGYNWTLDFSFSAGERVVVNMKSGDFDSYLEMLRGDGTVLTSNDDGGSGTDARLVYDVPTAGGYKIRAKGYEEDAAGSFVLWIGDRDPGTMNPGEACGPSSGARLSSRLVGRANVTAATRRRQSVDDPRYSIGSLSRISSTSPSQPTPCVADASPDGAGMIGCPEDRLLHGRRPAAELVALAYGFEIVPSDPRLNRDIARRTRLENGVVGAGFWYGGPTRMGDSLHQRKWMELWNRHIPQQPLGEKEC